MTQHQSNEDSLTPVVTVKPLEWGTTSYGRPEVFSVVGVYRINEAMNGGWSIVFGGLHGRALEAHDGRTNFVTVDAAKAAAQEDYEKRILSALILPDASQAPRSHTTEARIPRAEVLAAEERLRGWAGNASKMTTRVLVERSPRSGYSQTTEVREITDAQVDKAQEILEAYGLVHGSRTAARLALIAAIGEEE